MFGENLSRFYFDRYGIETVCVRIGSSFAEPKDRRMLATWLSFDDLERLVVACLTAPVAGHTVLFGMSDNTTNWWDNRQAAHIGFRPQDSSARFRAEVQARQPVLDTHDPVVVFQGGQLRAGRACMKLRGPVGSTANGKLPRPSARPQRTRDT